MNTYGFYSVFVDTENLTATVDVGRWSNVVEGDPEGVRTLMVKLDYLDEDSVLAMKILADSVDWSGTEDDARYYEFGGAAVRIYDSPSESHAFNWVTKQWEDTRTLQDFKEAQWATIKQARTSAEFGTFTYSDMVLDGDLNAQRRLASYISVSKSAIASGVAFQADFTLSNNTQVTLTAADFVGIEMAKVQQVAQAFAHAVLLRTQIEAATTREAVEAVVW